MQFNSFNFWLIFPSIFGIYWLIPAKFNSGMNDSDFDFAKGQNEAMELYKANL